MRRIACILAVLAVASLAAAPASAQCYLNCPGGDGNALTPPVAPDHTPDINGDGAVDIGDLVTLADAYLNGTVVLECVDFDCDGTLTITDLSIFAQHWGHHIGFPQAGGRPGYCLQ